MKKSLFCWTILLLANYTSSEGENEGYHVVDELSKLLDRLEQIDVDLKEIRVQKNKAKDDLLAQVENQIKRELDKHPTIIDTQNALNGSGLNNTDACESDFDTKIQAIVQELRQNITGSVSDALDAIDEALDSEDEDLQDIMTIISNGLKQPEIDEATCENNDDNCQIMEELNQHTEMLVKNADQLRAQIPALNESFPLYIHTDTTAARIRTYILEPVIECLENEFKVLLSGSR